MDIFYAIVVTISVIAIIIGIARAIDWGEYSIFFCSVAVLICTLIDWL